jgi:hypothetical protein
MKQLSHPDQIVTIHGQDVYPLATLDGEAITYQPVQTRSGYHISRIQITLSPNGEYQVWGWCTSQYMPLEVEHCPTEVATTIQWLKDGGNLPV